ncbi:helix-turn-helix domain-containing protein [Jeongeupia chitinilytica]|uniref:HTH cro/C1-type domain-containing protein n=1 Tax=Jeongeupia chitinilytica TaxID=1041641 RepID=A0ABQ3GY88_9NEIS|nr:helix-turn-helix transcriptional regulator [Jeongeupia chitinilytica]GHD60802.1 hypothetical protein GCM10007350_14400 [Jeongeupia chitinilytica]
MNTLNEILDSAKESIGTTQDQELARKLGIGQSTLSGYRHGKSTPDAYALMQLSAVLKKDARELLAVIEAERAKTEERRGYWEGLKTQFRKSSKTLGALAAAALVLAFAPSDQHIYMFAFTELSAPMYIMSSYLLEWLDRLLKSLLTPKKENPRWSGVF